MRAEPAPRRLYEHLRSRGEPFGPRPALSFARADGTAKTYSYDKLFTTVEELAARMPSELPLGPVGVLLDSQEDQVLHYLALLSCGRVPAILTPPNRKLDPVYYADTTRAVLARVGFAAIVTELDGLEGSAPVLLEPGSVRVRDAAAPGAAVGEASGSENAAFLQFSSGTTGIKKGVVVSPEAVLAQLDAYGSAVSLVPDDVIVSWLPLYHDMGFITALHLPLWYGAHAVMQHPLEWVAQPRSYLALVTRFRATLGWHPNFAFQFMVDRVRSLSGYDLSTLRGVANCSEPATFRAQAAFRDRFTDAGLPSKVFWGCYAMAETTFALTHAVGTEEVGLDEEGPVGQAGVPLPVVTVGRPLTSVDLRVEDHTGAELADGEIGEIVVSAPFLAAGYFHNPDATTSAFRAGAYRTGDLGYRMGDLVYVTGRLKDLLIVAGVNVHPGDIEALLSEQPGVQPGRVAAFSEFDERAQTERIIVLFEKADPDVRVDVAKIRQRLIGTLELSNFEVRSVPPGWLVKSSSGKMARAASQQKWRAERQPPTVRADPPGR